MRKYFSNPLMLLFFILLPFSVEASSFDLEKDLEKNLNESRTIIKEVKEKIASGGSVTAELTRLKSITENIKASHMLIQERFNSRGKALNSLGAKAVKRHTEMYEGYKKAIEEYLGLIDGLLPDIAPSQATIDALLNLLEKILPEKKKPIFGSLPYRNLKYSAKEPDETLSIKPAYKGGNRTVGDGDLKSTVEAPISTEMATLAQSLDWNPASIYEYVKNNVETEWYWGCMKGAEETLKQKSGNDCDQATLLTALLRASGFPSRYVRGVIEFPSMDQIKNLTGIDNAGKIAEFLQKAGIPFKLVMAGGGITNFQIEHLWVESLIPYANYRGAIIDDHGKTWLGLDTSIKVTGYTYNAPLDILQELSLDGLRDEYLGALQTQTPLEYIKTSIETYLNQNHPGMTYNDFLRTRTLIPEVMNILPASMQYDQITITHEYTEIPADLKHKVKFTASDKSNNELFAVTLDALQLSSRKTTISYEPETVEDQQIIDSYGGLDNTPAYLIRLRPVLKIDGERIIVGKDGLPMGSDYDLTLELISPNGVERVTNTQITGNLSSIGIVSQKAVKPEDISVEEKDAERLLHEEAINYIDRWNRAEDELASLLHVAVSRPISSVVVVGGVIDVTYLLNVPHGFEFKGIFVDADLRTIETVGAYGGTTTQSDRQKTFMQLSSLQGSALENRIFEDDFQVEGISTAKLFGVATATQPATNILTIDKTNISTILPALPFDNNLKEDVTNAVNQDYTVKIPQSEITYQDWKGAGYIKEDPATGESGYMLSGMIAGGMTAWGLDKWSDYYASRLTNPYAEQPNYDPSAAMYIQKVVATDMQSGTVGKELSQPLQVKVTTKSGQPAKGVSVAFVVKAGGGKLLGSTSITAVTNYNGIATAKLTLGTKTSDNPTYSWIEGYTYAQQIGENIVDAYLPSGVAIKTPFTAYGFPKDPHHVNKTYGDGESGPILSYKLISMIVEDEYNNPLSNIQVNLTAMSAAELSTCDNNPNQDTRQAYLIEADDPCVENSPTYGDCSTQSSSLQLTTSKEGAAAGVILGGVPNALYKITVRAGNLNEKFSLYSHQFGNCNEPAEPSEMIYISFTYPADAYGNNINAGKTGSTIPLTAKLYALREGEKEIDETLSCSYGPLTCKKIVGSRQYSISTDFVTSKVDFAGQTGVSQGGGVFAASYKLNSGLNNITITGTGTVAARRSYNTCTYKCLIYNPQLTASPTVSMQIYGVDISLQTPGKVFTDDKGYSMNDLKVNYTITPAEYKASTAFVELLKNGTPITITPSEKTVSGFATFLKGIQFDANSAYEVQVVLNYGTGVEIKSEKKTISLYKINLKKVSFSGTNYHAIIKDDGSGIYDEPHWQDNSNPQDGDADDVGDRKYPVSFTRNTKMRVSVTFTIESISAFGDTVKFMGIGTGNLALPERTAVLSNEITIADVEAENSFANTIDIFDPMEIIWKMSADGGATWFNVGISRNQVYITMGEPATTMFHTLAHIGCKNAKGESDIALATGKIWNEFTDRTVSRTDGSQLKYWAGGSAAATNTAMLLQDGNGQCGSWAEFLIDCLKAQGITGAQKILIVEATRPFERAFLVKNWKFIGSGVSSVTIPYVYVVGVDAKDEIGAPGQGNPDPPGAFLNHFIVKYGGNYYDPSYGTGPYGSQSEWENASLDGFTASGSYGGVSADFAKKNSSTALETIFEP